jgi:hypothetical protein
MMADPFHSLWVDAVGGNFAVNARGRLSDATRFVMPAKADLRLGTGFRWYDISKNGEW